MRRRRPGPTSVPTAPRHAVERVHAQPAVVGQRRQTGRQTPPATSAPRSLRRWHRSRRLPGSRCRAGPLPPPRRLVRQATPPRPGSAATRGTLCWLRVASTTTSGVCSSTLTAPPLACRPASGRRLAADRRALPAATPSTPGSPRWPATEVGRAHRRCTLLLGGSLHLHESPVAGHHHVHVGRGRDVVVVVQVQSGSPSTMPTLTAHTESRSPRRSPNPVACRSPAHRARPGRPR